MSYKLYAGPHFLGRIRIQAKNSQQFAQGMQFASQLKSESVIVYNSLILLISALYYYSQNQKGNHQQHNTLFSLALQHEFIRDFIVVNTYAYMRSLISEYRSGLTESPTFFKRLNTSVILIPYLQGIFSFIKAMNGPDVSGLLPFIAGLSLLSNQLNSSQMLPNYDRERPSVLHVASR